MKKIIITGTSKGIGKEITKNLLKQNIRVIGLSRIHTIKHENYFQVVYEGWKDDYKKLFTQIFKNVDTKNIHSISFGKLRFPESVYKKITKDNPSESLIFNLVKTKNIYESNVNENIEVFCKESLKNFIDEKKIFFNN